MDDRLDVLVATVRELAGRGQFGTAAAVVDGLHPSDLSIVLVQLDIAERAALIGAVDSVQAANAVWELEAPDRDETLSVLPDELVAALVARLPDDGAVDLLQDVPTGRRVALVRLIPSERAAGLERLFGHEETTAGGLMSPDFVSVPRGTPVSEVLELLRSHRETSFAYYVYVLDAQGHPVGVTSLREVVVARPERAVEEVARPDVVAVAPTVDQEEVARLASRYDLLAVPVVSDEGRMLGVVTADDVLEVLSTEADEDIERMAGLTEPAPQGAGLWALVRARMPWVIATFVVELAVAFAFLRPLPVTSSRPLLAYLPLLLFTGGTSAIAASGVALRRLREGERRVVRLLSAELQGGLLLAMVAAGASGAVLVIAGQDVRLTEVVAATTGLTVLLSSTVGTTAPILLRGLGRDPTLASGPLLGALADATALAMYLFAARTFL